MMDSICHYLHYIPWYKLCDKKQNKHDRTYYDIVHDLIKYEYYIHEKQFIYCIPRLQYDHQQMLVIDEKITRMKKQNKNALTEDIILYAGINDEIDVTEKLNAIVGNKGCHLTKTNPIFIKWCFDIKEMADFKFIVVLFADCVERTYDNIEQMVDEYFDI